ncbi:hypothetical protein HJG43_08750 [Kineosporiaceae bacterium SCSIO 59966]|nr:hypothetical protein HJG43_08750 [Kineosporiaceae bacterium SCSIO 59966]
MTGVPPERDDDSNVDLEAAWADIVANWDQDDATPVGRWPAAEDTEDTDHSDAPGDPDAPRDTDRADPKDPQGTGHPVDWDVVPTHVGGDRAREAAARPDPDDEEEGFVPPEPPPLPRSDAITMAAWAGVLGSPLFFLLTALFWRDVPQLLILVAVGAFVAGFVTLVARMPSRRDPGDDDDGAVV